MNNQDVMVACWGIFPTRKLSWINWCQWKRALNCIETPLSLLMQCVVRLQLTVLI